MGRFVITSLNRFMKAVIVFITLFSANFVYAAPAPPEIISSSVGSIDYYSVVVSAQVNPNQSSTSVYCRYKLSSGGSYSIVGPVSIGNGTSPVSVDFNISSLQECTGYIFQVYAINNKGTTYGQELSNNTLCCAASPRSLTMYPYQYYCNESGGKTYLTWSNPIASLSEDNIQIDVNVIFDFKTYLPASYDYRDIDAVISAYAWYKVRYSNCPEVGIWDTHYYVCQTVDDSDIVYEHYDYGEIDLDVSWDSCVNKYRLYGFKLKTPLTTLNDPQRVRYCGTTSCGYSCWSNYIEGVDNTYYVCFEPYISTAIMPVSCMNYLLSDYLSSNTKPPYDLYPCGYYMKKHGVSAQGRGWNGESKNQSKRGLSYRGYGGVIKREN